MPGQSRREAAFEMCERFRRLQREGRQEEAMKLLENISDETIDLAYGGCGWERHEDEGYFREFEEWNCCHSCWDE